MTTPSTQAKPSRFETAGKRAVLATAAIAILCVPVAAFAILSGEAAAASWAAFAGFIALINLMAGGRATGWLSVGLLTALVPVAIVSGAVPLAGAGLMAIMCFGVGLSAARGLNRGLLMIPLFLALLLVAPPSWNGAAADRNSTTYLLWNMVIWGGGGIWAMLVFPRVLHRMPPAHPEPNSRVDTSVYTVIITALCTASTLAVLAWQLGIYGAWLVITVLLVTQVGHDDTMKLTGARVGGTLVGVVIAAVLSALVSSQAVLIGLALVLLVMALVVKFGPRYWLFVAFLTPPIVLLTSTGGGGVPIADAARVGYTVIAVAFVILASAIAVVWTRYQETAASRAIPAPAAGA